MNLKSVLTLVAVLVCVGSLALVRTQRQELTRLRADRQSLAADRNFATDGSPTASQPAGQTSASATAPSEASSELLQLRSEVTRLTARKRELARVPGDSERLNRQRTNAVQAQQGATPLPPGYIRKAQARLAGYITPEDTIQTFLYALHNHDLTTLTQSLTPAMAQILQAQMQRTGSSPEEFFKGAELVPGLRILERETLPDGSVELQLEVAPGAPASTMQMQKTDGEWKMASPL